MSNESIKGDLKINVNETLQSNKSNNNEIKIIQLLFLDFEGVLKFNSVPGALYHESILKLERFLLNNPLLEIVFSTSFRNTHSMEQLRTLFPHTIRDRFVGSTPNAMSYGKGARQREIEAYLSRFEGIESTKVVWCAIDDRAELFENNWPYLVLVENIDVPYIKDKDLNKVKHKIKTQIADIYPFSKDKIKNIN